MGILKLLLKEYEEVKQKRKENENLKLNENKIIEENKKNTNIKKEVHFDDNLIKYEPYQESSDDKKPPLPSIDEVPLILPKIYKNYVKENIQLIMIILMMEIGIMIYLLVMENIVLLIILVFSNVLSELEK